jgi:hypothetical protein
MVYNLSHPTVILTFSWYTVPTSKVMTTESLRYNCFTRNEGNSIPKHACPEAKGSISTIGLITHSGEILTTGKSHKNKLLKLFPKYYLEMSKLRRIIKCCMKSLNSTITYTYNFIQISVS